MVGSPHWKSFEDNVRYLASAIFNSPCKPENIGGVDLDGVINSSDDIKIFIEITVRSDLGKVREDIIKLKTAKDALAQLTGGFARGYCIIDSKVTQAMVDAAKPHHFKVLSFEDFRRMFLNFREYSQRRIQSAFGSAVNPLTGVRDESSYVPVTYFDEITQRQYTAGDIANLLKQQRRIVLLGEYGTGKSRCIREIFQIMISSAESDQIYPIAIDLRDAWGAKKGTELIRRHLSELSLEDLESQMLRAFRSNTLVCLLDGFDELGSQAWSNDTERLRAIRARSLQGVKDLFANTENGALISGREHYFNNNEEMFAALGLSANKTLVLRCRSEFTENETIAYFQRLQEDITLPEWLPRRPLICQTIAELDPDELDRMFGPGQGELDFWEHFLKVICERDARINMSFDPITIERILIHLARLTRTKLSNTGPISLQEIHSAFEAVVGQAPVDDASVMLQRLPALGRVSSGGNERQFIDTYILDGLRAKDVAYATIGDEALRRALMNMRFINPLNDLGQRILAGHIESKQKEALTLAARSIDHRPTANTVLASDLIGAILQTDISSFDFNGLILDDGHFLRLDMSRVAPNNLTVRNSTLGVISLPTLPPSGTKVVDCIADRVIGVTTPDALPKWMENFSADIYDSVDSTSRIRQINLSPSQEILVTIVRKVFFQKGSGRKEEALTRGLSSRASRKTTESVLNLLMHHDIISKFKGSEGWVYVPNRGVAGRMKTMLYELKTSKDEIWSRASELN